MVGVLVLFIASIVHASLITNEIDHRQPCATPGSANVSDSLDCMKTVTTKIHEIQGHGAAVNPGSYTVEAVVIGDFQGVTNVNDNILDGFFIQEEDADTDADTATSEGIFVYCGVCPVDVQVGDVVRVFGSAKDYYGMSQLSAKGASDVVVLRQSARLPSPAILNLPVAVSTMTDLEVAVSEIDAYYEQFEGMLVTSPHSLTVTEYYQLPRYGEILLSQGGRLRQFTDTAFPDADAYIAHQIDVKQRTLILDDQDNIQNAPLLNNTQVFHPQPGFSFDNFVRGGDAIDNLTGVLHWSWAGSSGTEAWRVRPVEGVFPISFLTGNPRLNATEPLGPLMVAGFNLQNYFNTVDDGVSSCGPNLSLECRGANSVAEFQRQTNKLVAAICQMNADIVGLMELENNSAKSLGSLTAALNAEPSCGTYQYIDTGTLGSDAIRVGLIYHSATVKPVSVFAVLDTPDFTDPNQTGRPKNRPALAQAFRDLATKEQLIVVVNHFKSKGSSCGAGDDDTATGQGNCNSTRTLAAAAQTAWIATDPTGTGVEHVLVIGDINAYRNEDPVQKFLSSGYTDLIQSCIGAGAYSYVFDGQLGYLDHALANASLLPHVTGVAVWHINADESGLLDYNDTVHDVAEASFSVKPSATELYQPDPYRASDHDPVVIGLNLDRECLGDPAALIGISINTELTCTSSTSITLGPGVEITYPGALILNAPQIIFRSGFKVGQKGRLHVD